MNERESSPRESRVPSVETLKLRSPSSSGSSSSFQSRMGETGSANREDILLWDEEGTRVEGEEGDFMRRGIQESRVKVEEQRRKRD